MHFWSLTTIPSACLVGDLFLCTIGLSNEEIRLTYYLNIQKTLLILWESNMRFFVGELIVDFFY